jgi:pimeloyl-ACP methyl ester carboxylesterase
MRQAPTLLLLHGGPGFDHSGFKPAFAEMATVAQVVYLDLRGNGRSDAGPANKWSLEQWAEDVHSFCEALSIENPIVLGHSLGGIVAMVYAIRYPDRPSRLILSSTSTQPAPGERSFAVFDRLGGPRARAAAIAFWTDPNEDSIHRHTQRTGIHAAPAGALACGSAFACARARSAPARSPGWPSAPGRPG